MSGAIYMAASGAITQQMRLEVLSNNLANVNTVGFKEDRAIFKIPETPESKKNSEQELLEDKKKIRLSSLQEFSTLTDFSQGKLKITSNPMDLALEGKGFFCIQTPGGVQYTRNGNFTLNSNGNLVTQEGYAVLGDSGGITINGDNFTVDNFTVDSEGKISVDGIDIGSLKIVDFPSPYNLKKTGNTSFIPADSNIKEIKVKGVKVNQGANEMSNISAIKLMTEMIEVQRAFESYQKVIQSIDSVTSQAINEVGKLA